MNRELVASGDLPDTDWRRIACPQADAYDTGQILELAFAAGYQPPKAHAEPTWLDGYVTIDANNVYLAAGMDPAPRTHPNIVRAAEILRLWPEMYAQCQRLLHRVALFVDPRIPSDNVVGCVCGPGPEGFGMISATVDNHVGLAEALVHELAHHKLRAMGVDVERAMRLIVNDSTDLFPSPIRYDANRPMTAVLHAQYSYVHIAALNIHVIDAKLDAERDAIIAERSLAVILPKLLFGKQVLDSDAELDAAGVDFLAGLTTWTEQVLQSGFALLDDLAVQPVAFRHPLADAGKGDAANPAGRTDPLTGHLMQNWRPRRREDIESHVVSDGLVLYRAHSEAAHSLNSASRAIWALCDGLLSINEIAGHLAEKLALEDDAAMHEQLAIDVLGAVQQFSDDDLLVPDAASDPRSNG